MEAKKYPMREGQVPMASEPMAMARTTFTPAQVEVLNAVAHLHSEEEIRGLKKAISNFFAQRADEEMGLLWNEGVINEEVMNGWEHEHMRTPYSPQK